ncbi:PREDICTED: HMG-Y-related protein A-like isoform X2 [Camelina sativa]|nr:PREDICTED: HMG-Y-related protein A-like isoform X2 [Camelina sativa]
MIMEAIEALNDKNGSNKTTIAKQIESTQQTLPPSHTTLLSYHLNQMKKTGQLLMVKNNYMKPDPHAPPKRGRGRPPKLKTQAESAASAAAATVSADPPRSRGRPPKQRDPSEISIEPPKESGSGRPRGRPPKRPRTDSDKVVAPEPATGERRGRGRPPKVKPTVVAAVGC